MPELPTVCAWCGRERGQDGNWVERFSPGPVSHGICEDDLEDMLQALRKLSQPESDS